MEARLLALVATWESHLHPLPHATCPHPAVFPETAHIQGVHMPCGDTPGRHAACRGSPRPSTICQERATSRHISLFNRLLISSV